MHRAAYSPLQLVAHRLGTASCRVPAKSDSAALPRPSSPKSPTNSMSLLFLKTLVVWQHLGMAAAAVIHVSAMQEPGFKRNPASQDSFGTHRVDGFTE